MNKKEWLELGALAVGALAVWAVMTRGQMASSAPAASAATDDQAPSNYLSYNQSTPNSIPDASIPLMQPNGSEGGGPACASCQAQSIMFSGDSGFEATLNSQLGDIASGYTANILSQIPDYVSQFFNNVQGTDDATAAETQFASMTANSGN